MQTDCSKSFRSIMVESTDTEPSDMERLLSLWDPKCFLLSPHIQTPIYPLEVASSGNLLLPPCQEGRLVLGLQQGAIQSKAWVYGWRDWPCRETDPQFTLSKPSCGDAQRTWSQLWKGSATSHCPEGWHTIAIIKDASLRTKQHPLCHLEQDCEWLGTFLGTWKTMRLFGSEILYYLSLTPSIASLHPMQFHHLQVPHRKPHDTLHLSLMALPMLHVASVSENGLKNQSASVPI